MKINISRQNIFLLVMATVLLLFVLLFSFTALIPKGKEYREQRTDLRKVQRELKRHEDFNDMTFEELKNFNLTADILLKHLMQLLVPRDLSCKIKVILTL